MRTLGAAAVLAAAAGPVAAGCAEIFRLPELRHTAAEQGLTQAQIWEGFVSTEIDTRPFEEARVHCQDSTGGEGFAHCLWVFELGDAAADALLGEFHQYFETCLPSDLAADTGVNHPDRYDAWIVTVPPVQIVVALKDKSALGETRVTFRVFDHP